MAERSTFGLQCPDTGGDLDRFGHAGRIERHAEELALVDVDGDGLDFPCAEAAQLDAKIVIAALNRREGDLPFAVGHQVPCESGSGVGHGDGGTGYDPA